MRKIDNYENIQENQGGEFEKLPAGGYICKIKSATDVPDKQYLKIEFDIVDGQYRGWYTDIFKRTSNWYGNFVRCYSDKAASYFKGFITAIEQSNPGYKWAWDEKSLYKCSIGLVLGYEEYLNRKQEKKERVYVAQIRSTDVIRKGDFKVPELKKLDITNATFQNNANKGGGFESMNMQQVDEDLPF